jgi:hypothetical protein
MPPDVDPSQRCSPYKSVKCCPRTTQGLQQHMPSHSRSAPAGHGSIEPILDWVIGHANHGKSITTHQK